MESPELFRLRSWLSEYVGLVHAELQLSRTGIVDPQMADRAARALRELSQPPLIRALLDAIVETEATRTAIFGANEDTRT